MRSKALVLAVLIAASGPLLGAQAAQATEPSSCHGVFSGSGDGPLTKTYVSQQDNGDGTFTLRYTLHTTRTAGTYRVRDCAFLDLDGDATADDNEPLVGTDDKMVTFGADGLTDLVLVVTADEGQTVCDRGAVSGSAGKTSFTDKSNIVCTLLDPGTGVPTGAIGGLGLAGLAAAGFCIATVRSRRRPTSH